MKFKMVVETRGPIGDGSLNPLESQGPEVRGIPGITHNKTSHTVVDKHGTPYWRECRLTGSNPAEGNRQRETEQPSGTRSSNLTMERLLQEIVDVREKNKKLYEKLLKASGGRVPLGSAERFERNDGGRSTGDRTGITISQAIAEVRQVVGAFEQRVDQLPVEQKDLVKMIFDELDLRLVRHKTTTPAAIARKSARSIMDFPFGGCIREADRI